MISSMISWGSESMTREELVVSGYWGKGDWAKPCGVKIADFYSLSTRAPGDGGDSGFDAHGGVGETVTPLSINICSFSSPSSVFTCISAAGRNRK